MLKNRERSKKTPATGPNENKIAVTDYNLAVLSALNVPNVTIWTLNNADDVPGYIAYNSVTKEFAGYLGDGNWKVFGSGSGGSVSFEDITGDPYDNVALAEILNSIVGGISGLTENRIPRASSSTNIADSIMLQEEAERIRLEGDLRMWPATNLGLARQIHFGNGYNRPAIILFDNGPGARYGWGLRNSEMQFFLTNQDHFSWNTGGDFQQPGENEIMRLVAQDRSLRIDTPDGNLNGAAYYDRKLVVSGRAAVRDAPVAPYDVVRLIDIQTVSRYKGTFPSVAALESAFPTAATGDEAIVDLGVGTDAKKYLWDANDNKWVSGGGSGASSFGELLGVPYDNGPLSDALNSKEDKVSFVSSTEYFVTAKPGGVTKEYEAFDAYLDPVNDSGGIKSSTDLNAIYPNAKVGQKTQGTGRVYEKMGSASWLWYAVNYV